MLAKHLPRCRRSSWSREKASPSRAEPEDEAWAWRRCLASRSVRPLGLGQSGLCWREVLGSGGEFVICGRGMRSSLDASLIFTPTAARRLRWKIQKQSASQE